MSSYVVKSGNTLSQLAQQFGYGSDYMRLARENNISNPNLIRVGQVINYGGASPAPAPQATPAPAPQAAPVQAPAPRPVSQPNYSAPAPQASSGGGVNPNDANSIKSIYSGYAGWNDPAAIVANFKATGGSGKGGPQQGGGGIGLPQAPQIDLQGIYDKALNTAGVTNYQAEADGVTTKIQERQKALADAEAKINDNPFYSEATRVGRVAKLRESADADIKNLIGEQSNAQNKVSSAKADAQIRLNIASQQYNIQSQQYQQNLQQFNSLLTSGALNGVGDGDISSIALSTGMSTSMVKSIIDQSKSKEAVANKPSLMTVDDGVNQKVVTLDSQGNIVNEQILGPSTASLKNAGSNSELTANQSLQQSQKQNKSGVVSEVYNTFVRLAGVQGFVSKEDWAKMKSAVLASGVMTATEFDKEFASFKNPNGANVGYIYN